MQNGVCVYACVFKCTCLLMLINNLYNLINFHIKQSTEFMFME